MFDWITENKEIVILLITTIGGIISTWLQRKGKKVAIKKAATEEIVANTLIEGIQDAGIKEVKDKVAEIAIGARISSILDAKLAKKGYLGPR